MPALDAPRSNTTTAIKRTINFQQPQDSEAIFADCLQEAKAIVASYRAEAPTGCDPQNVGQLGNDFDPNNANYEGNILGSIYAGGLIGLVGFAAIGIGAFFSYGAAAAAPATPITTVTYIVEGGTAADAIVYSTGTVLTESQAAFVAMVAAGGMATEPVAVTAILTSWGFEVFTLDSLLALAAFNATDPHHLGPYFGGGGTPGNPGGGASTPPGFPGFGLGPIGWGAGGHGTLVCIETGSGADFERYCTFHW